MIEFIKHQGETQGERELAAQILCAEYAPFRRFGAFSSIVRQYGRLGWRETPGKSTKGHLVANRKER